MKLYQLNEKIYYSAYEEERDRPAIGYIKGERFSIAVDAGHSKDHLREFYMALKEHDLPLPALTVITHWHWDHSFAMHTIHGLSIASRKTNAYLKDFIAGRSPESDRDFLELDPSIAKEYEGGRPIIVVPADIEYQNRLEIDAGNTPVIVFEAISPHTDDATLVLVPEEKVLFFGDAISGVFPTWIADPALKEELIQTIEKLDVEYCIGGHWPMWKKEDLLAELKAAD